MPKLLTPARFRNVLKKISKPQTGWLDIFVATLGKTDGTVSTGTPGEIYVKNIMNGQILVVKNNAVPNTWMLQVEVGRRVDTPNLWQVKSERESYSVPAASGFIQFHAPQHYITGPDPVWLDFKQVLQLSVLSQETNLTVKLYGSFITTKTGEVSTAQFEDIDLSTYVPSAGAIYVNIEVDNEGTLHYETSAAIASREIAALNPSYIPARVWDRYLVAAVLLNEGQTVIKNTDILKPTPLEANYHLNVSAFSAILNGIDLIQAAFEALDVHTHADAVHHQYRQFTYTVSGGALTFLTDTDGNPLFLLRDLE